MKVTSAIDVAKEIEKKVGLPNKNRKSIRKMLILKL
jgi:hypothetical protein